MSQKQLIHHSIDVSESASADSYTCPAHPDAGEAKLVKAVWVPDITLATPARNYWTIAPKNGATTLGSVTTNSTGGTAWAAGTPEDITLSGGSALEFTRNTDALHIDVDEAGAATDARGRLELVWELY